MRDALGTFAFDGDDMTQAVATPASREARILADQANSIQGNIFLLVGGNAITAVVAAWIMVNPAPLS